MPDISETKKENSEMKKSILDFIQANLTPRRTVEEAVEDIKISSKNNRTNFTYWFPKIEHCGIPVPKSKVLFMPDEAINLYLSEKYDETMAVLQKHFEETMFVDEMPTFPIFMKTGLFSGKFAFDKHCKLSDLNQFGKQFVDLMYQGSFFGVKYSTEIVIREFLSPKEKRETIYEGMPLSTEFRVFYDFSTNEVVGCFNYWDTEYLTQNFEKSIRDGISEMISELDTFKRVAPIIETEYEQYREHVCSLVETHMKTVEGLEGIWSIDLMKVDDQFFLIDMAVGKVSAYYNDLPFEKTKLDRESAQW